MPVARSHTTSSQANHTPRNPSTKNPTVLEDSKVTNRAPVLIRNTSNRIQEVLATGIQGIQDGSSQGGNSHSHKDKVDIVLAQNVP
jgi:hypothetical protein